MFKRKHMEKGIKTFELSGKRNQISSASTSHAPPGREKSLSSGAPIDAFRHIPKNSSTVSGVKTIAFARRPHADLTAETPETAARRRDSHESRATRRGDSWAPVDRVQSKFSPTAFAVIGHLLGKGHDLAAPTAGRGRRRNCALPHRLGREAGERGVEGEV